MRLDLRIPMGLMFSILGLALTVYGLVSDPSIYQRSLGINVNLWWGLVMLAFGLAMLALSARKWITTKDARPGDRTSAS